MECEGGCGCVGEGCVLSINYNRSVIEKNNYSMSWDRVLEGRGEVW